MLGHKLAQVIGADSEVIVAIRGDRRQWPSAIAVSDVAPDLDVRDTIQLSRVLDRYRPDAVLNAAGVIKHVMDAHDPADTIAVNGMAPNLMAHLCRDKAIRFIHYSTDCVFTGAEDSFRGPKGYREGDLPDARDLYGMSKYLGEPSAPALVLRTSIIGRQLKGHHSLVDWFLSQGDGPVKGYTRALFTGLTTLELARVTLMVLRDHPHMEGLWHVAAQPIDKYSLLQLVANHFGRRTVIQPQNSFYCDRRLDGSRFSEATGWASGDWPTLIEAMAGDPLPYAN